MQGKMRAVQLFAPGDVRCSEIAIPRLEKDDDVIIKVKACGVCGSDIPRVMSKGAYRYPIVIGHEFSGEVQDAGSACTGLKPGDRVTVMPLINCHECDYCHIGAMMVCDDYDYYGSRIDGAMAEYIRVSAGNILPIPDNVSFAEAAMSDPASVALHAVNKAKVLPGQTVAVFGLGAIGFIAVQWLANIGCGEVIAVDVIDSKLNLAKKMGATHCINAGTVDPAKAIMEYTEGKGADACIEIAGASATQIYSLDSVRKMGIVVLCGISYDDLVVPNKTLSKILRGELIVKGSWNSNIAPLPINEWESSLLFMGNGKLSLKKLITHQVRLEDCQSVFEMMYDRSEMFTKVMFFPEKK
jgi:L-iditol 2-dehydrogenase